MRVSVLALPEKSHKDCAMPLMPYSGPIIDSHLHLFTRVAPKAFRGPSQGNRLLCRPFTSGLLGLGQAAHDVVGAIAVEAKPMA